MLCDLAVAAQQELQQNTTCFMDDERNQCNRRATGITLVNVGKRTILISIFNDAAKGTLDIAHVLRKKEKNKYIGVFFISSFILFCSKFAGLVASSNLRIHGNC